ncbi:uncharacterized protein [Ranitomeya imitator]|uniref:uncharacterized protein isoform X1 n=1 Tax=Ranitomeya imitator TaxID=111125 RepID=UPI0037E88E74
MQVLEDCEIPEDTYLVCLDVEALYTSISHNLANSVDFLDIKLSIENSKIACNLFRKATATNSLLHYESFHPQHLKNGIPKGQFLRLRRNCSTNTDFLGQAKDLTRRFKQRGYPQRVISKAFQLARGQDRSSLLEKKVREPLRSVPLITTFNNQWSDIRGILSRNWDILLSDKKIIPFISETPNLVARRAKNLKDDLCHSHYYRPSGRLNRGSRVVGSYPCGNCNICQFITASDVCSASCLPFQVRSREYFNCRSRNLVYAILCGCPKIYVGQTSQELKRRMQQHLSNIAMASRDQKRNKTLSSVAAHFLEKHQGLPVGFKVMGLESVSTNIRGGNITNALLRCESKWIYKLQSCTPRGLNEDLLFTGFYKQL